MNIIPDRSERGQFFHSSREWIGRPRGLDQSSALIATRREVGICGQLLIFTSAAPGKGRRSAPRVWGGGKIDGRQGFSPAMAPRLWQGFTGPRSRRAQYRKPSADWAGKGPAEAVERLCRVSGAGGMG